MKLKFNGLKTNNGNGGGCSSCGQKRKGKSQFHTIRQFILPSNKMVTFVAGRTQEVADSDANFLLQYGTVEIDGITKPVFEVVE